LSAILEIPEVRQRVSPLLVEEYHRLDEYNGNDRRHRVEVYLCPENDRYAEIRIIEPSAAVDSATVPAVRFQVSALFD